MESIKYNLIDLDQVLWNDSWERGLAQHFRGAQDLPETMGAAIRPRSISERRRP